MDNEWGRSLKQLESRAFGCLLKDLLDRCSLKNLEAYHHLANKINDKTGKVALNNLRDLQRRCLLETLAMRPLFADICEQLSMIEDRKSLT